MGETIYYVIVFLTNIIQAITGFAGTMLAMPLSIKLIGMNEARIALNAVATFASIYIVIKDYKQVNRKVLIQALIYMSIGTFISLIVYRNINSTLLLYIYGIVIMTIAVYKLFANNEIKIYGGFMNVILVLAGILHGLFASGGPFLVIYLTSKIKDKYEFRATVSAIWIVLGFLFALQNLEYTTLKIIKISCISVIPLAVGVLVGDMILKRISQRKFLKITYFLLLLSGVSVYI